MATSVCKYFQVGYCKFGLQCKNSHIDDLCPTKKCSDKLCSFRHPRQCKYFFLFGHCKFGDKCAYSHTSSEFLDLTEKVFLLETENGKNMELFKVAKKELEVKVQALEVKIKEKDLEILSLEETIRKSTVANNHFAKTLVTTASENVIKSFSTTISKMHDDHQKSLDALFNQIALVTKQLSSLSNTSPPRDKTLQISQQYCSLLQTPFKQPLLPTPVQPPLFETPPPTPKTSVKTRVDPKHSRSKQRQKLQPSSKNN